MDSWTSDRKGWVTPTVVVIVNDEFWVSLYGGYDDVNGYGVDDISDS